MLCTVVFALYLQHCPFMNRRIQHNVVFVNAISPISSHTGKIRRLASGLERHGTTLRCVAWCEIFRSSGVIFWETLRVDIHLLLIFIGWVTCWQPVGGFMKKSPKVFYTSYLILAPEHVILLDYVRLTTELEHDLPYQQSVPMQE